MCEAVLALECMAAACRITSTLVMLTVEFAGAKLYLMRSGFSSTRSALPPVKNAREQRNAVLGPLCRRSINASPEVNLPWGQDTTRQPQTRKPHPGHPFFFSPDSGFLIYHGDRESDRASHIPPKIPSVYPPRPTTGPVCLPNRQEWLSRALITRTSAS